MYAPQPETIRVSKINKFFGEKPSLQLEKNDVSEDFQKIQSELKAKRLLGESINIDQEKKYNRIAPQSENISEYKLRQYFGENIPIKKSEQYNRLIDTLSLDVPLIQPFNVNIHKLQKFFGVHLNIQKQQNVEENHIETWNSGKSKVKINKIFGERVDLKRRNSLT